MNMVRDMGKYTTHLPDVKHECIAPKNALFELPEILQAEMRRLVRLEAGPMNV